jgi:membrane protein DedA with SNARE-associated domain
MTSGASRLLTGALGHGGLLALAVLPIPPEIILPFAGFHVRLGTLGFFSSWGVATGASVLAALPLYVVARVGGRPLLLRHGRLLGLNARRIDRAERWFSRWGEGVVVFGRMVTGARSVVSVPAGLARMSVMRFTLDTALGFGTWNGLLLAAGWALGDRWQQVAHAAPIAAPIVGGVAAAVVLAVVLRRRAVRRSGGDQGDPRGGRERHERDVSCGEHKLRRLPWRARAEALGLAGDPA